MTQETQTYEYTREDFDTPAPYEHICSITSPFEQGVEERRLTEYAKSIGFKSFRKALQQYKDSLRASSSLVPPENISSIEGQDMELDTGDWLVDDFGVRKQYENEVACPHPIWPVERLKNIDTGELKVKLAFRRGTGKRSFSTILTDFDTVSNAKNIVSLSRIGISVTSGRRAQNLVDYIADVLDLNYDRIPETMTVSRMGWNDEGFAPYEAGAVFDGNANFEDTYKAIQPHGSYEAWLDEARACRKYSIAARLTLAASFASVLVGPLGCLPFFVHLWSMGSGTGKSVAQMLAASVWAEPSVGGGFFKTFKITSTGIEIFAGFLNSMPVIIDELQLAKDSRGKVHFNVYELASGAGKLRSNKTLGLVTGATWANCFITSGETPLVNENDGAGALNRVIEIECREDQKAIEDGHKTAQVLKANYGHAGQAFVSWLLKDGSMEVARKLYDMYFAECLQSDTTEKQAMAAALLLTADRMATSLIFKDDNALTVDDLEAFMKTKEAVSAVDRGYNYMCDWAAQNAARLQGDAEGGEEVYGIIEGDRIAYIVRSKWNEVCEAAGFNAKALLSGLRTKGRIDCRGRAFTVAKRINGIPTECVALHLPAERLVELDDDTDTPFE